MVLPTILYGLDEAIQKLLIKKCSEISRSTDTPFRIHINTDDIDEAIDEIRSQRNVSLIILGVESMRKDKEYLALRLGRLAMKVNRDHYVVYIVKCKEELEYVLPLCVRCAGILICPPEEKAILRVFSPLFEDYHRIYSEETSSDGHWLNLKSDGKIYRIRMQDICMVQAVNKVIEFHTVKETISIYGNMDGVEKMLDDSFIRCHRSYFINREMIQYIDFREMNIHMMDGSMIPLARSFKESMQRNFAVGKA